MSESNPQPNPVHRQPSRPKVFLYRLVTTVFLWGIVVFGLFAKSQSLSWVSAAIILLSLSMGAFWEYLKMAGLLVHPVVAGLSCLFGVVYLALCFLSQSIWLPHLPAEASSWCLGLVWCGCCYLLFHFRYVDNRWSLVARYSFGWGYVFVMMGCLIGVFRHGGEVGKWYLILMVIHTKFSDMGAYLVGSLLGKHKMIPKVSPGKTWEGFAGALLFAGFFGWLFSRLASDHLGHLPLWHLIGLGLVLGIGAVLGDLVESLLKREAGVKDSGAFLPGIGGALDLVDSLLFNAPLMYLYLNLFQREVS